MKTKRIFLQMLLILLTSPLLLACESSTNDYPPLVKKDFTIDEIYSNHGKETYFMQYVHYKNISTYSDNSEDDLREMPFPWNVEMAPVAEISDLLSNRLYLSPPEFAHEQKYISCITSLPVSIADKISELLNIRLVDYKLTDKNGGEIKIDENNGIMISYASLFKEYQNIVVKIPLAKGCRFDDIADGYIKLSFDIATDFDKVLLDKSQLGKTFVVDGVEATLIEMEYNTMHLKFAGANEDMAEEWEFSPSDNGVLFKSNSSSTTYPISFYEFARNNIGLSYADFEKEAIANETAWKDTTGDCCMVMDFYTLLQSLYVYKTKYTSFEKRLDIKGNTQTQ